MPWPSVMSVGLSLIDVTARSIVALTVVASLSELFAGVGSPWSALMDALSVLVPPTPGVTVTVIVFELNASASDQVQVSGPVPVQLPVAIVCETYVEEAGSVTVTLGFVAFEVE